ncbi:hypothetical protein Tco_1184264 [Tanacetum coccineum]
MDIGLLTLSWRSMGKKGAIQGLEITRLAMVADTYCLGGFVALRHGFVKQRYPSFMPGSDETVDCASKLSPHPKGIGNFLRSRGYATSVHRPAIHKQDTEIILILSLQRNMARFSSECSFEVSMERLGRVRDICAAEDGVNGLCTEHDDSVRSHFVGEVSGETELLEYGGSLVVVGRKGMMWVGKGVGEWGFGWGWGKLRVYGVMGVGGVGRGLEEGAYLVLSLSTRGRLLGIIFELIRQNKNETKGLKSSFKNSTSWWRIIEDLVKDIKL